MKLPLFLAALPLALATPVCDIPTVTITDTVVITVLTATLTTIIPTPVHPPPAYPPPANPPPAYQPPAVPPPAIVVTTSSVPPPAVPPPVVVPTTSSVKAPAVPPPVVIPTTSSVEPPVKSAPAIPANVDQTTVHPAFPNIPTIKASTRTSRASTRTSRASTRTGRTSTRTSRTLTTTTTPLNSIFSKALWLSKIPTTTTTSAKPVSTIETTVSVEYCAVSTQHCVRGQPYITIHLTPPTVVLVETSGLALMTRDGQLTRNGNIRKPAEKTQSPEA
ncbi:hypothetical protein ACQKWADRAFT_287090 [Trichoderma austrokoningii]